MCIHDKHVGQKEQADINRLVVVIFSIILSADQKPNNNNQKPKNNQETSGLKGYYNKTSIDYSTQTPKKTHFPQRHTELSLKHTTF